MTEETTEKKLFLQCKCCGRKQHHKDPSKRFKYIIRRNGIHSSHSISCPCGIMTRMCQNVEQLQVIWNSKPRARFEPPRVRVTHPPSPSLTQDQLDQGAKTNAEAAAIVKENEIVTIDKATNDLF